MYAATNLSSFFFFNDTATTEIYTLSLHDALPICLGLVVASLQRRVRQEGGQRRQCLAGIGINHADRKSTRLNSSHLVISYAVFCLKKKKHTHHILTHTIHTDADLLIHYVHDTTTL